MHLVSHYLQRPSRNRLPSERFVIVLNDICFIVQSVAILVHVVFVINAFRQTLVHGIISSRPFLLQEFILVKTHMCNLTVTENMYAFRNVTMVINQESLTPIAADLAIEMRLSIFIGLLTLGLSRVNKNFVETNVFVIFSFRNVVIWKDVLSALELAFTGYIFQCALATDVPRRLLRKYFEACGIQRRVTAPFLNVAGLYVFAGVGFFAYAVSFAFYLWHTIPQYGVLDQEEIEAYKEQLRRSKALTEATRQELDAAKEIHARIQLKLMENDFTSEVHRPKDDEVVL